MIGSLEEIHAAVSDRNALRIRWRLFETMAEGRGVFAEVELEEWADDGQRPLGIFFGDEDGLGCRGAYFRVEELGQRSFEAEQFQACLVGQVDGHVIGISKSELGQLVGDVNQVDGLAQCGRIGRLESFVGIVMPADGEGDIGR